MLNTSPSVGADPGDLLVAAIERISDDIPLSLPYQLGRERGFHCVEFGIDRVGRAKLGNFFLQALRPGQAERVGAAFGKVGAAFEQLELGERFLGAAAVQHFAGPGAGHRAFEPAGDRVLAGAGLGQLGLEPLDVGLIALEHGFDLRHFGMKSFGHFGRLLLFDQRGAGQVLATLFQRQLGLFGPAVCRSSSRLQERRISLMSAIERAAVARTSTNVSSISTMIMRIIRAGSSDRSSNSAMFAAMMSRVRVKIGPDRMLASGASGANRTCFLLLRLGGPRNADGRAGHDRFEFRHR